MNFKQDAYAKQAESIIKNLKRRNMDGYYFENKEDCVKTIMEQIPSKSVVSWGGSETLKESGILTKLSEQDYTLIDRSKANSPEESRNLFAQAVLSDYYFMSTNTITLDGQLINIDGNGNRVACLIQGPSKVIIIAGMNKVAVDVESGIKRIRNFASPANAVRLNKNIPCSITGKCEDCLSPECFCNQIVITRRSGHIGRIHVYLIGQELGY